ncbi:MAG TPA: alanine racemase [Candidatus Luteococcus avicola]|nr:alanine racemase [Candidatus Luteococcus avicola]
MSVTLRIETEAWRIHLGNVFGETQGLVPVAKGNGYGFGLARLAQEADLLGASVLAVGTADEVAVVRDAGWAKDIVVLTPWSVADGVDLLDDDQVIRTIGRLDDLAAAQAARPDARVILELLTSMRRHGLAADDLPKLGARLGDLRVEGWTIHLPMSGPPEAHLDEARGLASRALAVRKAPLWLSHLSARDYRTLAREVDVETHLRVGTKLWLGAPHALRTTARVLDVHKVRRGERIGYWQRRMPTDGWVVVVSGGTANGVALEAPTAGASLRQRAIALAGGSMAAAGLALSPYTLDGRKRFFVEPPHMQSSLVFLPGAATVAVGQEVPVELRLTTAQFDRVIG